VAWVACTVSVDVAVYVMQQQGLLDEGRSVSSLCGWSTGLEGAQARVPSWGGGWQGLTRQEKNCSSGSTQYIQCQ